MMTPQQEQALLDATALGLDDDLRAAYAKMLGMIREGMAPRDAIQAVQRDFRGQYAQLLADGFSAILGRAVGGDSVLAMKVSGVTLSQRLYQQSRETSAVVSAMIDRHVKGFDDARKLTLAIYEGYGFKPNELLKLSPKNPKLPQYLRRELLTDPTLRGELQRHFTRVQAANLKTPALRAAYLQYLDGIEKGAGQDLLDRRLSVAYHERMRYLANRIAQTELHRSYTDRQAVELMADAEVEYVQIRMSQTHPRLDICDMIAGVDRYGLGKGVYPTAEAPKPPFHPFCRCMASPRLDLYGAKARAKPGAEQAWLRQQSGAEAAQIMGSRARRDAVLKGADPLAAWNERADPMYHVKRVGEVDGTNWPQALQPESVAKVRTPAELAGTYPVDKMPTMKTLSADEKREYSDWARAVLADDYRARHEFRRVGFLPARVMADTDVQALRPVGDEIEISDHQLRHGRRPAKIRRGQALTVDELALLPAELEKALWLFDSVDKNLLAVFEVTRAEGVGKAAIRVNHVRGGTEYNAVVTTGFLSERNLKAVRYREI